MALSKEEWQEAAKRAKSTAAMANTLAKALARRHGKRWQFMDFLGPKKAEARGIVDILAIRKDGKVPLNPELKRLDLFEIILIQVKGGSARSPTYEDIRRLRTVAQQYQASNVVLFEWTDKKHTGWSLLSDEGSWLQTTAASVFGK